MSQVTAKTHLKIMVAAKDLVARHGRAFVRIADVTRHAGVSKATIYRDAPFLEWWKETSPDDGLVQCPNCEQMAGLEETIKLQKAQIRALERSVETTTAALAALSIQLRDDDYGGPSVHVMEQNTQGA